MEWIFDEQQETTDESINSELVCPQVEVTEHCSPIDWSQIQSTSTPRSNSVARSLVDSYSSISPTASTTSSSCQTNQGLSSRTPRKESSKKC